MDAKLARTIRRIENSIPGHGDLDDAMRSQMARIKFRTSLGRDVNGFPFLRKKGGSPSYLHKTGLLLRSLQAGTRAGERGLEGRITVTGRARAYAPFVNANRKFLGVSNTDKASILADVRQAIKEKRRDA